MTRAEASLGKTRYWIEDHEVGTVRVVRSNSDGVKEIIVPKKLLIDFAIEALGPKIHNLLRSVLL